MLGRLDSYFEVSGLAEMRDRNMLLVLIQRTGLLNFICLLVWLISLRAETALLWNEEHLRIAEDVALSGGGNTVYHLRLLHQAGHNFARCGYRGRFWLLHLFGDLE